MIKASCFQKVLSQGGWYFRHGKDRRSKGAAFRRPLVMPLCEAIIGVAIILVVSLAFAGRTWGLLGVQPHPLWIVVLAIAVRYGAAPGYLAGALSAITYGLLLWTRPEAHLQLVGTHELIQPLLMFVIGAVLGELVDARERRIAGLETSYQEAGASLESLRQRNRVLEEIKLELEKGIAFQSNSILTLSTIGKKFQSLHVPELHRATVDLVSTVLEAEACSLYLWHEGHSVLEVGIPKSLESRIQTVSAENILVNIAISQRRVATIKDSLLKNGATSISEETPLMAGPLTIFGGQLYGVVIIESMPFLALTPSAIDRLEMILGWASAALENAFLYQKALFGTNDDGDLRGYMINPDTYQRTLAENRVHGLPKAYAVAGVSD